MTNTETKIIIRPAIPLTDVTVLEHLILTNILSVTETADGLLLFSDFGARQITGMPLVDLIDAHNRSRGEPRSTLNAHIDAVIATASPLRDASRYDEIDVDMTGVSWDMILQDIVARSATLTEVSVLEWFNDRSHRPGSFGANIILITADANMGKSSADILEEFRLAAAEEKPSREMCQAG